MYNVEEKIVQVSQGGVINFDVSCVGKYFQRYTLQSF